MTPTLHEFAGRVEFRIIEKLSSAYHFQIARETMLLLIIQTKMLETRKHAIQGV